MYADEDESTKEGNQRSRSNAMVPNKYVVYGLPFSLVQHVGIGSSLFKGIDRFHQGILFDCASNT